MANVILANSYFYRLDQKQWRTGQPYPPLATLFVAAGMRAAGRSFEFVDNCLQPDLELFSQTIRFKKASFLVIFDDGFNYLTKMCLSVMQDAAFKMIQLAKEEQMTVIVSSSDATDHYLEYHQKGADFVLHGEADMTLLELLSALEGDQRASDIAGLSYQLEGHVHKTAPRQAIKNLDELPMPAWDLVDINSYEAIWMKRHGYYALNVATTRGCPFKCNWCAKPIYGNRYNSRSPKGVVEEIEYLSKNLGVNYFWMCDDIFGLKPGWVREFSTLVRERKLQIGYKIQSRADLLLKEQNIRDLVDSGLDIAWIGAESGSQSILDAMDKGITVDQISEATSNLRNLGAKVGFFLQFGYPGEGKKEISETISMLLDLMPDEIGVSISYPLPGTVFYENVKSDLVDKTNWTDSDDLDMMFAQRYPKAFYRRLHRYVHHRYCIKKGILAILEILKSPLKLNRRKLRAVFSLGYHVPLALLKHLRMAKHG